MLAGAIIIASLEKVETCFLDIVCKADFAFFVACAETSRPPNSMTSIALLVGCRMHLAHSGQSSAFALQVHQRIRLAERTSSRYLASLLALRHQYQSFYHSSRLYAKHWACLGYGPGYSQLWKELALQADVQGEQLWLPIRLAFAFCKAPSAPSYHLTSAARVCGRQSAISHFELLQLILCHGYYVT